MANDNNKEQPTLEELKADIDKRKQWFFECQLRWLTLGYFRDITAKSTDVLLELIADYDYTFGTAPQPVGMNLKKIDPVYLDSKEPIWTLEVWQQKDLFVPSLLGSMGDFLSFKQPVLLAARLADLKKDSEQSRFGSGTEDNKVNRFFRRGLSDDSELVTHAISRVEVTTKKPWLIPEIFNSPNIDATGVEQWIQNGETFISNYEHELDDVVGGGTKLGESFNPGATQDYRNQLRLVMQYSISRRNENAIKTTFLDQSADPWKFNIKIDTPSYRYSDLKDYPYSDSVKYWVSTINKALSEVLVNKQDSDMSVCMIMRVLYLYGTLPAEFEKYEEFNWRNRQRPTTDLDDFFAEKAKQIKDNSALLNRLETVRLKLSIMLDETANSPCSSSIQFSPLAERIIKSDLLGYKFWLDENFKAYDNVGHPGDTDHLSRFSKARVDLLGLDNKDDLGTQILVALGISDKRDDALAEMEYWSENHYIMFASSEFLAGQLWQHAAFEPAYYFLNAEDQKGELTGTKRMARGRARVLKWLNNKLMFGWMEFNSSGYYREHLYALLNLVDFSLDKEVRDKAKMVTDLLLFDVIRFSHKGSTGAAGGRCQFKSKHSGWDGSLGDVLEIILGERGIFADRGSEIGCFFSTSVYKVPDVLLRIGHLPADFSFTDRSRVSISFEEAPKYGIDYSQQSDQRDSFYNGFAPKRTKHYPFLGNINQDITNTHNDYGPWQDDTIFWWGMSAFYNQQVVKNTFACVDAYKLHNNKIFGGFQKMLVKFIMPLLEKSAHGLLGGNVGGLYGAAAGFFYDDITGRSMIEKGSDALSTLLDGSTRTRANILTYRNRDVMLSSLQNFRAGQFNFQSNVNQATLSSSVNVFTTSAFSGIDLSGAETGIMGGIVGGFLTQGPIGALAGFSAGILADHLLDNAHLLYSEVDGPSWWTGYWSLPMIVQHENAAIIAYDFSAVQKQLADTHSHVWFPTSGFDETQKKRSSAYEDDNFFLWDITSIGPKGFWLFGKIVHPSKDPLSLAKEEGYIGVFSNQEPRWLDMNSDFYADQIDQAKNDGIGEQNKKLESDFIWDYFADKDWSVDGKNIWIIQVGSNLDFGSFENFKDKVSQAKVLIDDVGDMACSYNIPQKDGGSKTLSLKYEDDGAFSLDGRPFETDLYPRFENPFIRGGRAEWGQREYVIEFNGSSLVHDYSSMIRPLHKEDVPVSQQDSETVKALVIYLKTEDEEMEVHTVATASVNIGCISVATDEVVAAGKVNENSFHDAEWIFFDEPASIDTDMTIDIYHNLAVDIPWNSDGDTEWKMTFRLSALMGDRSLKPCTVRPLPLEKFYLRHGNRHTGPVPFSIQLSKWRTWTIEENISPTTDWMIAGQPGKDFFYFDYIQIFSVDEKGILSTKKIGPCNAVSLETNLIVPGDQVGLAASDSFFTYATRPGYIFVFFIHQGVFYERVLGPGEDWSMQDWESLSLSYQPAIELFPGITIIDHNAPPVPVPIGLNSRVFASFIDYGTITPSVFLQGADGNIYTTFRWPLNGAGNWRKIETASIFTPNPGVSCQVAGGFLFVMDKNNLLWRYPVSATTEDVIDTWQLVLPGDFVMKQFKIIAFDGILQIVACSKEGNLWALRLDVPDELIQWERIHKYIDFVISADTEISCVSAIAGRLDVFAVRTDGHIYTTHWTEASGWQLEPGWIAVQPDDQTFKISKKTKLQAISRVNGMIELYVTDDMQKVWKNWWS